MKKNNGYKYVYEVFLESEYGCNIIYDLRDKYTKWFDTQKQAIEYARSIKKELKDFFKDKKINNTITLDVNQYWTNIEETDENYCGIVYSLNILGKY